MTGDDARKNKHIRYCNRCVMPETKPDLYIDEEGVCNACRSYENRAAVDWDARKTELREILEKYRNKNNTNYDCIVPVSGGKDSTFQAVKLLEMGMNPLCVTSTTCKLSEIGRKNIENLKMRGVDYIEFTTNPLVRRKINRIGLRQIGDISWPEHLTIFTIPVRLAVQMNIPLLVWGENSQNEYGGPAANAESNILDRRWLEEFGGLLGLRVTDLIGQEDIKTSHLVSYTYPTDKELKKVGVTGLFLGYYFPWDGYANALFAQGHGMQTYPTAIEGSLVNYENLDNLQTGIHDYFKFIKYGFGRTTDFCCLHLRRGRLTREDALELVKMRDGKFPWTYLGVSIEEILKDIDVSIDEFVSICDRFTNKRLFKCDARGNLIKDRNGNLTKINYDNMEE
ncbi:MAG: N-acetyl sugar amidotransferase [candidate division Zixibacteria bacterium]